MTFSFLTELMPVGEDHAIGRNTLPQSSRLRGGSKQVLSPPGPHCGPPPAFTRIKSDCGGAYQPRLCLCASPFALITGDVCPGKGDYHTQSPAGGLPDIWARGEKKRLIKLL